MKKAFFSGVLCILSFLQLHAQEFTATFEDGTQVDYEVFKGHTDLMNRLNILLYANYADLPQMVSVSYFLPDAFTMKANAGYNSYGVEGLVFLSSFEKPKSVGATIKSNYTGANTVTRYQAKVDITRKTYFGIHAGYTYKDYGSASERALMTLPGFIAHEVVLGVGLTRGKFLEMIVKTERKPHKMKGTTSMSLYADMLLYPVRSYTPATEDEVVESINDISTPFGFRAYFDGKSSIWGGKRDFGFCYQLGAGYYTLKKIKPIVTIGIYAGF